MPSLILIGKKGGYTSEGRSILKIMQKVFFPKHPQLALAVLNSMVHTEVHHGTQFLVDRLKNFKSCIIRGEKLPRTRKSKFLKGFKCLSRTAQFKLLSLVYRWRAERPTRKTYAKFCKSINQGRSFTMPDIRGFKFKNYEIDSYINFTESISVNYSPLDAMGVHILAGNKAWDGPAHISDEMIAMTEAGQLFIDHAEYLAEIFQIPDDILHTLILRAEEVESTGNTYVGRISALVKDGALKLRHIANLVKGWQVAISPLVEFYKMIEKTFPQSANWAQLEGAAKAAVAAGEGFSLSSFDFVSSTDNIPRDLFFILMDPVMEALPNNPRCRLLKAAYAVDKDICSKGIYLTPFNQRAFYDIGQAMGRWTSKQQLNLTNIRMNVACGGSQYNSVINGDDTLIWDDEVSKKFEILCNLLGIPLSKEKTFLRKRIGEFSGRIITAEEGVLPVFKGRKSTWMDDPFGFIRQYGTDGLSLIPDKKRSVVKRVAKYLTSRELGVDFGGQHFEADFLLKKIPTLTKEKTSQLWVDQLFNYLKPYENIAPAFDQHMGDFFSRKMTFDELQKYTKVYHKAHERPRQLQQYKYVAVKRFHAPRNRLDTLVDDINSYIVKTTDGALIEGYGNGVKSRLYERLLISDTPFKAYGDDDVEESKKHTKIKYVNRLNKIIRRWNIEISKIEAEKAREIKTPVKKGSLFWRFIKFVFS